MARSRAQHAHTYSDTRPRILAQLSRRRQTSAQIIDATRIPEHMVRNHLSELRKLGTVRDTGERKRGAGIGTRPLIVWELVVPEKIAPVLSEGEVSAAMARALLEDALALAVRMPLVERRVLGPVL
jgi:predicted ArsR family transcriptional regulator